VSRPGKDTSAEAVDAMTGKPLTPLIDKEAVLEEGFWGGTVLRYMVFHELSGFRPKLYESIVISFTPDGQSPFLRLEVVDLKCCDLSSPGPGVIEEMQNDIVTEPVVSRKINTAKDRKHILVIQEAHYGFLRSFLGNARDSVCGFPIFRIQKADHFSQ
jgi:hypothetical protein